MLNTIAAIATGNVVSAIGILRLSGEDTFSIIDKVFIPSDGLSMSQHADRSLVYGKLLSPDGDILDICLCTKSTAPNSYTGENTAEIHTHGSPTVLSLALDALFAAGARQALAGEFTKRAFLNGKLDLTMAEAVIDLIDSETKQAAINAAGQLSGAISRKTDKIYTSLIDITSHYYAVVDYPDEDIEPFEIKEYSGLLKNAADELYRLLSGYERGRVLKEGIYTAIIGRPNAGKSSLLNLLLGYERAIVTDIPGTTRDTVEEKINLGGVLLRLCDTAGIRDADDTVEKLGVMRAVSAASSADLVIVVLDGASKLSAEDFEALKLADAAKASIAVINKSDLEQVIFPHMLKDFKGEILSMSAASGDGLYDLSACISRLYPLPTVPAGEILTNARQAEVVRRAHESISAAYEALISGMPPDAVLTEAETAMNILAELSGRAVSEDITHGIFSRFCVGK